MGLLMSEPHDNAGVIAPPPLIFAAGLLIGFILHALLPVPFVPVPLNRIVGAIVVILSVIPGVWALAMMNKAHTSPIPEAPTTALVTDGPFAFTRNPIYLTFTIFYVGVAIFVNGLLILLELPFVLWMIQKGVIEREEAYLERKFGDDYRQYKARVRRWL